MRDGGGGGGAPPIALHGGAEFLPGDEPFLAALLAVVPRSSSDGLVRVVIVPVAAARQRPDLAGAHGQQALRRVAGTESVPLTIHVELVVDRDTAGDAAIADRLAAADLVYLPGGEPDLVPAILRDTPAWAAVLEAHGRGAVVAGASAGAMGLAATTWTPSGFVDGLGLLTGLVVVPHFESFDAAARQGDADHVRRDRLGAVCLDERTGVIRESVGRWRVAGAGRAVWQPPDGDPIGGRDGDRLPIPA